MRETQAPTQGPSPVSTPPSPSTIRAMRAAVRGATSVKPPPPAGTIVGHHTPYSAPVGQARHPNSAPSRGAPRPTVPSAHSFLQGLRNIVTPIAGMDPRSFTDTYGPRIHPITGRSSFHTGIDISASAGTPVIAPSNAVLADLNAGDSIYGNQLILAHNRKIDTMYGHLSSFAPGLKPGMKIRAGDLIGYVGSTGLSTGPHLHWETWRDGDPVNPVSFLGG